MEVKTNSSLLISEPKFKNKLNCQCSALLFDRQYGLNFVESDGGIVEQLTPTLSEHYPKMLKKKKFAWVFADDRRKVIHLTKQFWTEYFEFDGKVDWERFVAEAGKKVDKVKWQQFLEKLQTTKIPKTMREIFHQSSILVCLLFICKIVFAFYLSRKLIQKVSEKDTANIETLFGTSPF